MTEIEYDGHTILASRDADRVREALRWATMSGPVRAAKHTGLPTPLVCLYCRMADIEYDLPEAGRRGPPEEEREQIRKEVRNGHDRRDVALWHGISLNRLNRILDTDE